MVDAVSSSGKTLIWLCLKAITSKRSKRLHLPLSSRYKLFRPLLINRFKLLDLPLSLLYQPPPLALTATTFLEGHPI
jgi:hypothetical protein